jgi:hypothetical protein
LIVEVPERLAIIQSAFKNQQSSIINRPGYDTVCWTACTRAELTPHDGNINRIEPCNTMAPAKPDISSICKLETLERRGFKVVILRLTGDGYFSNAMEGLKALAREHAPGIGSAGEVTHFLLLDLANVGLISDWFSSFMLIPIRANAPRDADGKIKRFVPAVALIDPAKRHQSAFECLRFHRVLGYFADEAAACAAMTPHGFVNLLPDV